MNSETPDSTPAANQGLASQCPTAVAAHTPGPWEAAESELHLDPCRLAIAAKGIDGDPICVIKNPYRIDATDRANARLIAAAPDLLAALREIVRHSNCRDAMAVARAALAKVQQSGPQDRRFHK